MQIFVTVACRCLVARRSHHVTLPASCPISVTRHHTRVKVSRLLLDAETGGELDASYICQPSHADVISGR